MNREFSKRTKVLLLISFNLLLLTLLVAAGELILRNSYDKIQQITGVSEWKQESWKELTYFWDRYHPRFGWTNQPSYRSDEQVSFKVSINNQGLRGVRDYSSAPKSGIKRIAMFGDSCMFGEEVDDHETLAVYLEQRLSHAEVMNFGVHGYGLGQMVLRMEEEGLSFGPKHVIFVLFVPHDLLRVSEELFVHNKPVFYMEGEELALRNVPVPEASRQPWIYRQSYFAAWLFGRPRQFAKVTLLKEHITLTEALLKRVKELRDRQGISLTVVAIASARYLEGRKKKARTEMISDRLRAAIARSGLDVLDLFPNLTRAYEEKGDVLVAPQGHWSASGNALIAGEIARHLSKRYPGYDLK